MSRAARRRRGQAFRPGMMANRASHGLLYIAFSIYFAFPDFPATVHTLLCFAEFLLRSFTAAKSVLNALASVRVLHVEGRFDTQAFKHVEFLNWKRALPFTFRTVPTQAPPLPLEVLVKFCELAASLGQKGKVFATLLSVTFFSLARISSLLPASLISFDATRLPCVGDVTFGDGVCYVLLKWAKNRQDAAQGFKVPLVRCQHAVACPVRNLGWLLQQLRHSPSGTPLFTFPNRVGGSGDCRGTGFTIRLAREWLACFNAVAGSPGRKFTFHSFRRGACTLAFDRGAHFADLQQLGGWSSQAVTHYFSADTARRRAASFLEST